MRELKRSRIMEDVAYSRFDSLSLASGIFQPRSVYQLGDTTSTPRRLRCTVLSIVG